MPEYLGPGAVSRDPSLAARSSELRKTAYTLAESLKEQLGGGLTARSVIGDGLIAELKAGRPFKRFTVERRLGTGVTSIKVYVDGSLAAAARATGYVAVDARCGGGEEHTAAPGLVRVTCREPRGEGYRRIGIVAGPATLPGILGYIVFSVEE